MKITTLVLAILLLSPFISYTQTFPDFGVITAEEIAMKECAFDKDATAVILINEAVADHDDEYHLITKHHVRIKILKEKGFEEANVSLHFYRKNDFEFIDQVEAVVINTDANGTLTTEKLSKKLFYTKDINERIGMVTFTFPNIKVGSIIEYKYRSFMKSYSGLGDWYFQKELPVVKSKYTLTVLPTTEFSYVINKSEDMHVSARVDKETGKVFLEMENIPSLTEEPYMDAREDYVQKVVFQLSGYNNNGMGKRNYMTSWDEVIKELLTTKEFGNQLGKNLGGTGEFIGQVEKMTTAEEKMKAVYNYVRKNMSWNQLYSKYAIDGIKEAWEKKKGNSADINLILVNLLKEAGLEAYPTLVSERFHGKVNTQYPFIDQFNSVFACVQINGKKYYLDATDEYTPAHMTPNDILNTTALIVHKKNGGLVQIANDSLNYNDFINLSLILDNNGAFSGETYVKSEGYSRVKKVSEYKVSGQEKYLKKNYQRNNITVTGFEFINQDNDSLPLEQKFKFTGNLTNSGDYLYVPLNLFSGFEKNPFINEKRFSNINFGFKRMITVNSSIELPANYVVDALPKGLKMTTPDKDIVFSRHVTYDKESHSLICNLAFDFKNSMYSVGDYPVLKEVYKKMFDYLKEPVVLKKK